MWQLLPNKTARLNPMIAREKHSLNKYQRGRRLSLRIRN